MVLSKCAIYNSQIPRFIKDLKNLQDSSGLLSSLGIEAPLNKIPLFGNILF